MSRPTRTAYPRDPVRYRLSAHGRILEIDRMVWPFRTTGGRILTDNESFDGNPVDLTGLSVWKLLGDPSARILHRAIFNEIRRGETVSYAIGYDTPESPLQLHMTATRAADGIVEVGVQPACAVGDTTVNPPELPNEFLVMCAWCRRLHVPERNAFIPVGTAIRELSLFERMELPQISHGICEPCRIRHFPRTHRG